VKAAISNQKNFWTPIDERNHRPSIIEWWCMEGFFRTKEDNKRWSLKTTFTEWLEQRPNRIGSFYINSLFDLDTDQSYHSHWRDDTKQLSAATDYFEVKINQCMLRGTYPEYEAVLYNDKKKVEMQLHFRATTQPRFVAQEVTGGFLPMGLGTYRYGFIPNGVLTGKMIFDKHVLEIDGLGYHEHVWGDFSYINPFKFSVGQTLSTYAKLVTWRLQNAEPRLPTSISLTSENNPFGYDWVWGVLDNGWSFFYGNALFWLMKGPAFGTLILTKDGKTYHEFSKIHFHYDTIKYSAYFDLYYPTQVTITAESTTESLRLTFQMTNSPLEYINRFQGDKFYRGFVIIEGPGMVTGHHDDGNTRIPLRGICKIEPQRQISVIGHNQLDLSFIRPPHGVGIDLSFASHFLKKHLKGKILFNPWLRCSFSLNTIDDTLIHKN
jgi:hypothetical protein